MAVRTEHLAFRDFERDRLRAPTLPNHCADVHDLFALVVEVEQEKVGLAAADAGMAREVLTHEVGGNRPPARRGPSRGLAVSFRVALVPNARSFPLTGEADPLPCAQGQGAMRKGQEWLKLATDAAAPELI
jgi:hypothetical protein